MAENFKLPFAPIPWDGQPLDFTTTSEDNPALAVHTVETTQRHVYGRRKITWDGRVYKYSKSSGRCYTGRGNVFANDISSSAAGIDYSVLAAAAAIGSKSVKMTNGSTTKSENELAGGWILMKPTETYTDAHLMMRGIVGNDAMGASATGNIYLDAPIETAMTTSNYAFCMPSPYNNIKYLSTSGAYSFSGLAAAYVSATGYNFWTQTWGYCWIAPQSGCGATSYYRAVYWRHDGSVDMHDDIATNTTDQRAGFIMDANPAANGSTLIMLQCDI